MDTTALSLLTANGRNVWANPLILNGSRLIVPQNLFFLWLGEEGRFRGVVDASAYLTDYLKDKAEDFSGYLLDNIKAFPCNVALSQLYNHEQGIYPLLGEYGSLAGYIDRVQILDYLNNEMNLKLMELEAVFYFAHNGIVAINNEGIITSFNPAAEKLSGVPKEKALGRPLVNVLVPSGLLDVVSSGKSELSYKYQVGNRKYITNRTPIIQRGKIAGAVGVFQEISELERISQELNSVQELNKELSTILDSSYDGVLVTDEQGIIRKVNKASERIIGFHEKDMVNRSIQKLAIFPRALIEKACITQKPVTSLVSTGSEKSLLVTANPVFDEQERVKRIVINVRDMTELNQLRNHLNYIKGLSDQYQYELTELKNKYVLESGIIATSRQMVDVINRAIRVADFDSTVLILGESGVGKEVIAKLIHNNSGRRNYPFVKINCGAIPDNLLESELFGYEPGAFTGAAKDGKMGLFEVANKGTLLLDEVGDMPYNLQVKILRVLQEKEVMRVGDSKSRKIDVRIIAATNHNLEKLVDDGAFRKDLYFRLCVVPIIIPPLRERREDIVPIIFSLLKTLEKKYSIKKEFSSEVIDLLVSRDWPGNIRELENVVERLFVTCPEAVLKLNHIPSCYFQRREKKSLTAVEVNRLLPMKEAIEELEKQLITRAMTELGSTHKAAQELGVNQSTIWRKWQKIQRDTSVY